jgi:O-antigen/teichoic acid export membrane protein
MTPPGDRSMAEDAFRGVLWTSGGRIATQFVGVLFGIFLARLLSPEQFGLVGMIAVVTGFATLFSDLGLGAAMIHSQDTNDEQWSSVFWVNAGVGVALTAIVAGIAPLWARFFDNPQLVPVMIALSAGFTVAGLGIVPSTLLKKRLEFKRLMRVELSALVFSGTTGVALALAGAGVWSLVGQSLAAAAARVVFLWREANWRPRFHCSWWDVRHLAGFSSNALAFSVVNYWLRNGDNLLVGKFIGASALGVYTRCYSLMLLPLNSVSRSLADVLFPTFSRIQEDRPRVAQAYLRCTQAVAAITFPMMTGLCVLADPFVRAVYGDAWVAMIPILQVFCPVGAVQSIGTLNGTLYLSQGRSGRQLVVGTVLGVLGLAAIALGLRHGLMGVASYYAVFAVIAFVPSMHMAVTLVDLSAFRVTRHLLNVIACSAIMGALVFALDHWVLASAAYWLRLVIGVAVGVAVQIAALRILRVPALDDVIGLTQRLRGAARASGA